MLFGNIAEQGCVVKTAGVDEESLRFTGPAHICESQEAAVADILEDRVKAGDVVVVRYEGRAADRACRNAISDQLPEIQGSGKSLCSDYRWSILRWTSGLSIGHVSPEAAGGGAIALIEPGDLIEIDIPARSINVKVDDTTLAERRANMDQRDRAWQPMEDRPDRSLPHSRSTPAW